MEGEFVEGYIHGDYVDHFYHINGVRLEKNTRLSIREGDRWIHTMMMYSTEGTLIFNNFYGGWYLRGTRYYESYMENLYARAFIPKKKY